VRAGHSICEHVLKLLRCSFSAAYAEIFGVLRMSSEVLLEPH